MPRKAVFYIVLALFIFALGLCYSLADWDLWARLIVGKTFFQTGIVLQNDFLSYVPTHRWLDHEWGSSVVFYFIQHYFSDMGLFVFKALMVFLIFFMIIQTIILRGVKHSTPYNFLFFFFVFHAMAEVVQATIRCQIFTFFFFTLWIYVLERVRLKGENRLLWILPATMIIWANLHGGCFAGLGVLVIYTVGEFLNKKPYKKYIFTVILCFLATFINPYGFEYVKFLLMAATMKRPMITEWQSSFSKMYLAEYLKFKFYFAFMSLTALLTLIKTRKIKDWTKTLMLLVMFVLAFRYVRHQPFFVITAAIFLYDDFYGLFNGFMSKIRKIFHINNPEFIKNFVNIKEGFVYFCIVLSSVILITQSSKLVSVHYTKYPIQEIEFIKINNLRGNLFTGFHNGSYAAYKLYPQNFILMDGRYEEVYYPNMLLLLGKFHLVNDGWDDILKLYHSDILLIDKKYEIYYHLKDNKDYAVIFEGSNYAVFVPVKNVKEKYIYPSAKQIYYDKIKFQTDINWNQ